MNILRILAIILILIALIASAFGEVVIKSKMETTETPEIEIKSKFEEFVENFSLKLESKPDMTAYDVFMRKALSYNITDDHGTLITKDGLDIDKDDDVILGYSDGSTELLSTKKREDGSFEVWGSFRKDGIFYAPPNHKLAVHHLSTGEKLCIKKTPADNPLAIAVLIDTSGSMVNVLDTVKYSTDTFLKSLPASNSVCAVATFKLGFEYGHKYYQACDGNFGYENAVASGGTDIYFVLADAYKTLAGDYFKNHQKAVVIITDGYTLDDEKRKQELLKLKGNTLTFVSFLGGEHRDKLEGITDSFLPQDKNIKDGLEKYFSVLSKAYNARKTVIAQSCTQSHSGGSHAQP